MPKFAKSSKQKSKQTDTGDYPNKGKLGDMGPDPRMYAQPRGTFVNVKTIPQDGHRAPLDSYPHSMPYVEKRPIRKSNAAIAVSMALGGGLLAAKLR